MGATGNLALGAPNNPSTLGGTIVEAIPMTACAASNAWVSAGVFDVSDARVIRILVKINAAAVGNIVSVIPKFAFTNERPVAASASTDDWYNVPVSDGTVTSAAFPGAYPANTKITNTQLYGSVTNYPIGLRSPPAQSSSERIRMATGVLNVTDARWIQFEYQQTDSGTAPSVSILYAVGS